MRKAIHDHRQPDTAADQAQMSDFGVKRRPIDRRPGVVEREREGEERA